VLGLNPHAVMVGLWYRRRAFEANNKKIFERDASFGPFLRMDFGSGQYENMMQL
jgi:hypothetical protein